MYPSHPPTCWRNGGSVGSIAHTLWFCKSLSSFWKQIFVLISISGTLSAPTLTLALLHLGIEKYPLNSRVVIRHLLFAAKLNITRLWKTLKTPFIFGTIADLNLQCEMEKIVARKKMQLEKFVT